MVVEVNGTKLEVWSLDTNVLSEMLKNSDNLLGRVLDMTLERYAVLGLCHWVVYELRRSQELYLRFIDRFAPLPFVFLKTIQALVPEEIQSYHNRAPIDPRIWVHNPSESEDPVGSLRTSMTALFENPVYRDNETSWNKEWQESVIPNMKMIGEGMLSKGTAPTRKQLDELVDLEVMKQVALRHPDWVKGLLASGEMLDTSRFPSLITLVYTVYYRFRDTNREPTRNDVMDVLIAANAPYVDCCLTEKFQAEIYRKIGKRVASLKTLRVETLKSLAA